MLLDIQKAKQDQGKKIKLNVSVPLDNSYIKDRGYLFQDNCSLDGYMVYEFERLVIVAKAKQDVLVACDKCGKQFVLPISFEINEAFSNDLSDTTFYGINPASVDIDKALIDNLLFNLPTRVLCKPDCKGLCPVCGKDLNKQKCNCKSFEEDDFDDENPFAKLKNLKNREEI